MLPDTCHAAKLLNVAGPGPTGSLKSFDVLYSTAAKWRDGRIIEEYLFWDNGTFLRQVGLA
jgi:hypothetical protein